MGKVLFNNKEKRIVFIGLAFVSFMLFPYILDPYSPYYKGYFERPWFELAAELGFTLVLSLLVSESGIYINNRLNHALPWQERAGKRLMVESLLLLASTIILNAIVNFIFYQCISSEPVPGKYDITSQEETRSIILFWVTNVLVSFMIMAINTGIHLIEKWKDEAVKTSELNQVAVESELQALKLQIDPHFVFNNLSVLSELILEDQQLGYDYSENFTSIYRYMLLNSKKNIISLEEELKFLRSYMFLIKHRVGEGVHFIVEVSEQSRVLYMPPFTLQILVENAIKHNKVVKTNPMQIKIYSTPNDELVVENSLLPVEKVLSSSGIGLANITRRYSLLSSKEPAIIKDDSIFKVIIPLLKYDQQNFDH